jgi:hypothetical protein
MSVRKVVLTLTSKSAEICLSIAGAKQLVTRGLSWFQTGPYVQQWCARGTILRFTVGACRVLTVNSCIKIRLDLQADKSPVVVKGLFFPRVVNPRYRIRGTNV